MNKAFEALLKEEVRSRHSERGERPDGRGPNDIRPITIEVGVLPRTHGSGLFTRGQTQVLSVATLGTGADEQMLDGLGIEEPSATSTTTTSRPSPPARPAEARGPSAATSVTAHWPSARSMPVLPSEAEFPYVIRVVSEVLSSQRLVVDGLGLRQHACR